MSERDLMLQLHLMRLMMLKIRKSNGLEAFEKNKNVFAEPYLFCNEFADNSRYLKEIFE